MKQYKEVEDVAFTSASGDDGPCGEHKTVAPHSQRPFAHKISTVTPYPNARPIGALQWASANLYASYPAASAGAILLIPCEHMGHMGEDDPFSTAAFGY